MVLVVVHVVVALAVTLLMMWIHGVVPQSLDTYGSVFLDWDMSRNAFWKSLAPHPNSNLDSNSNASDMEITACITVTKLTAYYVRTYHFLWGFPILEWFEHSKLIILIEQSHNINKFSMIRSIRSFPSLVLIKISQIQNERSCYFTW